MATPPRTYGDEEVSIQPQAGPKTYSDEDVKIYSDEDVVPAQPTQPRGMRAMAQPSAATQPSGPGFGGIGDLLAGVGRGAKASAQEVTAGLLDIHGKAIGAQGRLFGGLRDIVRRATMPNASPEDIALYNRAMNMGLLGERQRQAGEMLTGASEDVYRQAEQTQREFPRSTMGKVGTTIGGVLPHLTPAAPATMGAQGWGSGYQTAKEQGADEKTAQLAGLAQASIGTVLGGVTKITKPMMPILRPILSRVAPGLLARVEAEVAEGVTGTASKWLLRLAGGTGRSSIGFAGANIAGRAIQEAANPKGGSLASAAFDPSEIAKDVVAGAAFHAIPALAGAGARALRGKVEYEGLKREVLAQGKAKQPTQEMQEAAKAGDVDTYKELGGAAAPEPVPQDPRRVLFNAMRKGKESPSEALADLRDKLDPAEFRDLYTRMGRLEGAQGIWADIIKDPMADSRFVGKDTGNTYELKTSVDGNEVTSYGMREGIEPAERPSATIRVEENGDAFLTGIDNKGEKGMGSPMLEKTLLAAIQQGVSEDGVLRGDATPDAQKMLSKYEGFKAEGRQVEVPVRSIVDKAYGLEPERVKTETQQRREDAVAMAREAFPGDENKAQRHEIIQKAMEPKKQTLREAIAETQAAKVAKDIQRAFGAGVGEAGEQTKESIREIAARAELSKAQRWERLKGARAPFDRMPEEMQHQWIDAYEAGGEVQGPKKLQDAAAYMREQYDKKWQEMKDVGIDKVGYIENYLTLMAKDKSKVDEYIGRMKKTLAGEAGFLKTREIANYKALREMGIEPEFTNPIDIATVSMAGMDRLIKAKRILNAEIESGRVVEVDNKAPAPEGMIKLDEKMTRKIGTEGKSYYAEPGVGTVFNNHVSQGFESSPNARNLYRWARTVADTSTSMQLALNGFHFVFAMRDAAASTLALAEAEFQRGNWQKGLLNTAKAITPGWSQIDLFRDGRTLRKALLDGKVPEDMKPLAEAFVQAGGRASSSDYRISVLHKNALQQFRAASKSLGEGDIWKGIREATSGAVKTPIAIAELVNKPLMEHLIPTMKIGVFSQLAAHEIAKGEPNLRGRLQNAWQITEDRLGQMTYDNLFWHQAARQLLHLTTRSVGWNLGSINVAMGAKDAAGAMKKLALTGKIEPMTHRANYIVATLALAALDGMMIQYLMGQGRPKPLKNPKDEFIPYVPGSTDMFAPRTGGTDRFGRPNRTMPAGYTKDLAEFARIAGGRASLVDFIASKMNPALSLGVESLRNKGSMGEEIGGVGERLAHVIPTPIGMTQVGKGLEEGKSLPAALAPAMGFPEPKVDLISTHAENVLRERLAARRAGTTAEESEARMKLGRLAEAKHSGNMAPVQEAIESGDISRSQLGSINARSREKSFFQSNIANRGLTFDDLFEVWKAGNAEERAMTRGPLMQKFSEEIPKSSPKKQTRMRAAREIVLTGGRK